jgi:hypothetical protein
LAPGLILGILHSLLLMPWRHPELGLPAWTGIAGDPWLAVAGALAAYLALPPSPVSVRARPAT